MRLIPYKLGGLINAIKERNFLNQKVLAPETMAHEKFTGFLYRGEFKVIPSLHIDRSLVNYFLYDPRYVKSVCTFYYQLRFPTQAG